MQMVQLGSFPIEQVRDLEPLERRLGDWFAGRAYPVRMLALSQRFDVRVPRQRLLRERQQLERLRQIADPLLVQIDRRLDGDRTADPSAIIRDLRLDEAALLLDLFAGAPALQLALSDEQTTLPTWAAIADALSGLLWRLHWQSDQIQFYDVIAKDQLRRSTYLMLAWEPADAQGAAITTTLQHAFGRAATPLEVLPPVLGCAYREHATYLEPEQPGHPYLAALLAYDMRGVWDATTLHALLDAPFDLALAVDVQTLGRNKAMRMAELAFNTARMLSTDTQLVDVRAQRVQADAELVLHQLTHQDLHLVQLAVLVSGDTPEALSANIADIQGRLGTQLRLLRANGAHGEALKLWSTTPAAAIDLPWKRRAMLSHGLGCLAGVSGFHRSGQTDGFFWGLDARRKAPLFIDLFQGNRAGHMILLGQTGSGKTFFLNLLALRGAAVCGYRVIGIDAFENGKRMEYAAPGGSRYNALALDTPLNVLDIVFHDEDSDRGWLAAQVAHAIGQIGMVLGVPGESADGLPRYLARPLSNIERNVLDRALVRLYDGLSPTTPLAEMPLLSDLMAILETEPSPEAATLARELRMLLYGSDDRGVTTLTTAGQRFNAPTGVDWNFEQDITYVDFSAIAKGSPELLPFMYSLAIGAINRFMRDPSRDRSRKTLLQIDEFGYLTRVKELAALASAITKVARKFGIALIAVDQNPATFYESSEGRAIVENTVAKVLFRMDDLPARTMAGYLPDLTPDDVAFISHAGRGQALAVIGNDVHVMTVTATAAELRVLSGS